MYGLSRVWMPLFCRRSLFNENVVVRGQCRYDPRLFKLFCALYRKLSLSVGGL